MNTQTNGYDVMIALIQKLSANTHPIDDSEPTQIAKSYSVFIKAIKDNRSQSSISH
jgi:hypothetical protein